MGKLPTKRGFGRQKIVGKAKERPHGRPKTLLAELDSAPFYYMDVSSKVILNLVQDLTASRFYNLTADRC